jgi:hypothetical protein
MRPSAARSRTRSAAAVVSALALAGVGCGSGVHTSGPHRALVAASATTTAAARAQAALARGRGCDVRAVPDGSTHVASGAVATAAGSGSVWVAGFDAISRLDPAGGRVVARIRTPGTGDYSQLAVGGRSVWATSSSARGVVYRIDPRRDRVIATVKLGGPVQGIAVGSGRVWVTRPLHGPGQLIAIDPSKNRVTRPPIEVGPGPAQVVYALHAVWVQNTSPSSVMRVDPAGGRVTTVIATTPIAPGSPGPGTIAVGYGWLWSLANGSLSRVDPVSAHVRSRVPIPRGTAVAFGDGRVWVLAYPRSSSTTLFYPINGTAALWDVDADSGRVTGRPIRLGAKQPIAIAAARRAVWIADYDSSAVTRIRLITAGCGAGERASSPRRRDVPLTHQFVDRAHGAAVRYPSRVAAQPATAHPARVSAAAARCQLVSDPTTTPGPQLHAEDGDQRTTSYERAPRSARATIRRHQPQRVVLRQQRGG